jgi:TRAP-type C4-dicarboxylate transport system permease small subunit
MARTLTRLCDLVTEIGKAAIALAMAAIVLITITAVIWRYVLNAPIAWIEQVSNMLFIWMIFIGAAILYRQMLHIAVDFALEWLPAHVKPIYFWVVEILNLSFIVLLFIYSLKLSIDVLPNQTGALDISPAWFYFSAPVSSAMMILFFVEKIFDPDKRVPHGHAGDF